MRVIRVILFLVVIFLASVQVNAQSNSNEQSSTSTIPDPKTSSAEQMDTEESIKYVGNQLLFQLKKRLHLTDEKEEKEQKKVKKTKKLSFFGIEIERD